MEQGPRPGAKRKGQASRVGALRAKKSNFSVRLISIVWSRAGHCLSPSRPCRLTNEASNCDGYDNSSAGHGCERARYRHLPK
jgi:hypothetical protein